MMDGTCAAHADMDGTRTVDRDLQDDTFEKNLKINDVMYSHLGLKSQVF